jgi:hypothetical protein
MRPEDAAKKLRELIGAPASAVSVWAWHGQGGAHLVVRVEDSYPMDRQRIPARFRGFEVTVERRQPARAAAY